MSVEENDETRVNQSQMDVWLEARPRIGSEVISTGKRVFFREMDGADQHKLVLFQAQNKDSPMPDAQVIAMCACHEDGKPLFNDVSQGIALLQSRPSKDLRKVAVAILRFSHLVTNDKEAEELEKKS